MQIHVHDFRKTEDPEVYRCACGQYISVDRKPKQLAGGVQPLDAAPLMRPTFDLVILGVMS